MSSKESMKYKLVATINGGAVQHEKAVNEVLTKMGKATIHNIVSHFENSTNYYTEIFYSIDESV